MEILWMTWTGFALAGERVHAEVGVLVPVPLEGFFRLSLGASEDREDLLAPPDIPEACAD